jgi:hypothetical protein
MVLRMLSSSAIPKRCRGFDFRLSSIGDKSSFDSSSLTESFMVEEDSYDKGIKRNARSSEGDGSIPLVYDTSARQSCPILLKNAYKVHFLIQKSFEWSQLSLHRWERSLPSCHRQHVPFIDLNHKDSQLRRRCPSSKQNPPTGRSNRRFYDRNPTHLGSPHAESIPQQEFLPIHLPGDQLRMSKVSNFKSQCTNS